MRTILTWLLLDFNEDGVNFDCRWCKFRLSWSSQVDRGRTPERRLCGVNVVVRVGRGWGGSVAGKGKGGGHGGGDSGEKKRVGFFKT